MHIILLGPPGAGKGTQAEFICESLHIPFVSTGDIFREMIQSGTKLGVEIKKFYDAGELVPDDIVIDVLKKRISQADCRNGFLLDGFPRNVAQAKELSDSGIKIDYIIEIKIDEKAVIERLSGRRIHPGSGRTYHLLYHPPQVEGKDDITGEPLIQRTDDKLEVIQNRLRIFHSMTTVLNAYYQWFSKENPDFAPKYVIVDGSGDVKIIRERIANVLKSNAQY